MKIVVVGAGAIGSLLGAILSRVHEVTVIARPAHAQAIRQTGLRVEGEDRFVARIDARDHVRGLAAPDLVLLTVKSYDTLAAVEAMAPIVGEKTIIVTAQNGLGNLEVVRAAYPRSATLAASVTYGAFLREPGSVVWNGSGEIVVGGASREATVVVVEALRAARLNAKASENVQGTLWLKAIINSAINPLTAIHRVPNGRLLEDARLLRESQAATREGEAVAKAHGIQLPVNDAWVSVAAVAKATAQNRSSMLQSMERGQRTEIDAITGAILDAANAHGIECPVQARLFAEVKRLEAKAFA